jgi:hypothetical protein
MGLLWVFREQGFILEITEMRSPEPLLRRPEYKKNRGSLIPFFNYYMAYVKKL